MTHVKENGSVPAVAEGGNFCPWAKVEEKSYPGRNCDVRFLRTPSHCYRYTTTSSQKLPGKQQQLG
jgi:hypothetical protein